MSPELRHRLVVEMNIESAQANLWHAILLASEPDSNPITNEDNDYFVRSAIRVLLARLKKLEGVSYAR